MSETPARAFGAAFKRIAAPELARWGFAASGRTWKRVAARRLQAIDFQQNRYNSKDAAAFTVNLSTSKVGQTSETPPSSNGRGITPLRPGPDGRYATRIGHILPVHTDFWYGYDPADQAAVENTIRTMLADLETHALPWLDDPIANAPIEGGAWARFRLRWLGDTPRQKHGDYRPSPISEMLQAKGLTG